MRVWMIVGTVLTALALPAGARAATLNITVGNDPTESITTQIGVSGSADSTSSSAYLKVKPAGGPGCGANPSADSGDSALFDASVPSGPYARQVNWTFDPAASYLLCAWLRDNSNNVAAAKQTIAVRPPRLSLSLAGPAEVASGQLFQFATTVQTETNRAIYVYAVPNGGRGCPANASAASSTSGEQSIEFGWEVTGGPQTDTRNVSLSTPGPYLVCGYVQHRSSATPPQATALVNLNVLPPCVVPAISGGSALESVKSALASAGCSAGAIRYAASTRYKKGMVIRLGTEAQTQLAPRSPVSITLSTGKPCVVPSAAGKTLSQAKKALTRGHCGVGKVTRAHSGRYRRGRVIRLTPKSGSHLATGAKIRIVVAR